MIMLTVSTSESKKNENSNQVIIAVIVRTGKKTEYIPIRMAIIVTVVSVAIIAITRLRIYCGLAFTVLV